MEEDNIIMDGDQNRDNSQFTDEDRDTKHSIPGGQDWYVLPSSISSPVPNTTLFTLCYSPFSTCVVIPLSVLHLCLHL